MTEPENHAFNKDPRSSLLQWANKSNEWVRRLVRQVFSTSGQVPESDQALTFRLLLEEKGIDSRILPSEPLLANSVQSLTQPEPFSLVRISNIKGVNALVEGEHIDFGIGLTLLYGENGMGKTGYARILKKIAGSRSAEDILSDVNLEVDPPPPSADIDYSLGGTDLSHQWNGEEAQPPFTLMSIFDNRSANLHVDADLQYTYRPASLAFFDRVNLEVQHIGELIEKECQSLNFDNSFLLSRFNSSSSIYPYIESLGPATNLEELQKVVGLPDKAAEQAKKLENTIAALRADVVGQQISLTTSFQKVLAEALAYTSLVGKFKLQEYNAALTRISELHRDQTALRDSLFADANLPTEPEQTWEAFVRSGLDYRRHLENLGVRDDTRCLYCRQLLGTEALELIVKYGEYLESRIAQDIEAQESTLQTLLKPVLDSSLSSVRAFCEPAGAEPDDNIPAPTNQIETLRELLSLEVALRRQFIKNVAVDKTTLTKIFEIGERVRLWLSEVKRTLEELREQDFDREKSQSEKEIELLELKDQIELKNHGKKSSVS